MKKILIAVFLSMFAVLPMSAMAMQAVSDSELSAVTGQAGVSINVDLTTHLQLGTVAWGDSDGFGTTYTNAGFVGISGLDLTFHISGRHDGPFVNIAGPPADMGYLRNKPIMIDVGATGAGATVVRLGLPTSHITVSSLDTDIFVSGVTAGAPTSTTAQQLGHIYMSGVEILLGQTTSTETDKDLLAASYDAGYVTIGAAGAGNTGVNIGFNIAIDSLSIPVLSYGNTTSILASHFGAAATAGYVGVTDLTIGKVNLAGGVAIGIGTLNGTALGAPAFGTQTMVNIIIADGTVISVPGAITGTVKLASDKTLTTGAGTLGNFYINGVTATFQNNVGSMSTQSLVQIWAH